MFLNHQALGEFESYSSIWSILEHFKRSVLIFMILELRRIFNLFPSPQPSCLVFLFASDFTLIQKMWFFSLGLHFFWCKCSYWKPPGPFRISMSRFCFFLLGQFLSSQPIRTALMMSKVRFVKDTQVIYYNLPLFWEFIYWQGLKDLQINEYINSRTCQQKLQRPFAYHWCQLPKLLWSFKLQLSQARRPSGLHWPFFPDSDSHTLWKWIARN